MASLIIQGTVPNLYQSTVLSDYARPFVSNALASIDTNDQTIFKIKLTILTHPFFKVTGAHDTYNLYTEHEARHEYCWEKPQDDASIALDIESQVRAISGIADTVIHDLVTEGIRQLQAELAPIRIDYQDFLVRQKEIVEDSISKDLTESWEKLREEPVPIGCDRLQRVVVTILLKITTVDRETASHESLKKFEALYRIEETNDKTNQTEVSFQKHKYLHLSKRKCGISIKERIKADDER
jgi:hypothetical protein